MDGNKDSFFVKNLHKLVSYSVKKRLMSDVPLGMYLSGGLDSSLIAGIMTKLNREAIKTFSIGYDVKGFEEYLSTINL